MDAKDVIHDWESKGSYRQVLGRQIFVVEAGNLHGIPLLFLHGYPSCSFDYKHVFDLLKRDYRLIAHDHLGFGLSDKPLNYSYSLLEQAEVALALWQQMGIEKAHLVAHDYGTSVATEILALHQRGMQGLDIRSVTLSNGSIHIELAKLRWIQKVLRHPFWGPLASKFSTEFIFARQMRSLWYDKNSCDKEELKVLWKFFSGKEGRKVVPVITRYLDERYKFWHRWIGALKQTKIPAHILWAQDDPVAVKAIGEQLYAEMPGSAITRLDALGHYPMLEDPKRWVDALIGFIHRIENEE
ncbi:MAG: alpha/beta hydrolase [Bacteroidetes bacterium]|nr:alpha/beta hydrolase [Bacteroidota bacterium]